MSAFTIMFKQDAQDDDEEPQELKVLDDARACARIAECDAECYTWWLDTLSQREKKERASALAALIMLMGQHNTQTARNIETQDPSVIFACLYQERCPVNICTTAILLKGLYCEDVRRREHGGRFIATTLGQSTPRCARYARVASQFQSAWQLQPFCMV
jgi:hypothetical protein